MGEVYRARDRKLGRDVAIKVLPADFLADAERLTRFEREARALASLNHANVATLHGFERDGDLRFLIMELVEGEDLKARIARGSMPASKAVPLLLQIAAGLETAHERGIVHRDLKPANIRITANGDVKLLDFGLAKALVEDEKTVGSSRSPTQPAEATAAGALMGTAPYMSPEQLRGAPVDRRTDIWSFGCLMFEVLSGRRAFQHDSIAEETAAILKEEPEWSLLPSSVPPLLNRLLHWCLTKDVRHRFQHIGDVRILLGEALEEDPVGNQVGSSARGPSWRRLLPAGLAAFVAGAAIMWLVRGPESSPQQPQPAAAAWDARPLTVTGDAWNVTISPDGETVAYLTAEGLVTHDVQAGGPNLILPDPGWGRGERVQRLGMARGEPQWLWDGSGIAFNVRVDSSTLGISSVPRMGGEPVPKLVTSFRGGEVEANFQSLPGDAFLLARVLEDRTAAPWLRLLGEESEVRIDVPTEIENLWDAAASPDAGWIAYIGERADRTNIVATISRDGNQHHLIAQRGTELSKWGELSTNRQWADHEIMRWPRGDRVYYRQYSSRGMDIHAVTIDLDTGKAVGNPELVLAGLPPGSTFDVAAGGQRLVYSGGIVKTQIRLFRFDLNRGGDPTEDRALTRGTARHVAPRFSPDGKRLAYIRKTGRSEDIFVVPAAGGDARRLRVLSKWNEIVDLKWSPSGDALAVYALTPSGTKLMIVSLSDSRVRELSTRPVHSTWFDWSPDGEWITYGTASDMVYVLHHLSTGEEREMFRELDGEKIQAIFSATGRELLVNNIGLAAQGLWAKELDGEEVRLVTSEASLRTYPLEWTQDGTIYLLDPNGVLFTLSASGGSLREFGRIPGAPIWEGWADMWIEGGSLYLACAIDEPRESDVWVLDRVDAPAGGGRASSS